MDVREINFTNSVFKVCTKIAKKGVHYKVDENGIKIWNDYLHSVIQTACIHILDAFDEVEEDL